MPTILSYILAASSSRRPTHNINESHPLTPTHLIPLIVVVHLPLTTNCGFIDMIYNKSHIAYIQITHMAGKSGLFIIDIKCIS